MTGLFDVLKPGGDEWALAEAIDPSRLPAHIAIIMDGNGRWARRRNLPRVAGHRAGMESVRVAVDTGARLGLQALTLYAFSIENWKRPRFEVDTLWRLLRLYLQRELPEINRQNIRLNAFGRLDALQPSVRRDLEEACAITYSGRAELVDALNAIIEEARREGRLDLLRVDEATIASRLYTAGLPDPD